MYPMIREYMSTELSQREFCDRHQIELHLFRYWLKKYRDESASNDESGFSSIELELPAKHHILIRTKSGVEIQIPV